MTRDVVRPEQLDFDGETYDPELDRHRLTRQLAAVLGVMTDGQWRTLAELSTLVHAPEASVSARLRDLRKPRFGFWIVLRQRVPGRRGLHQYRVLRPEDGGA